MPKRSIFAASDAEDRAYANIRRAENDILKVAKQHCEQLWERFETHADPEFLIEFRRDFYARYWEMYLTVSLMEMGYEVISPKRPGPDVGILFEGQRIWFEATCPSPGEPGSADAVPAPVMGAASAVPSDKIVLRYLNSASEKVCRQYPRWVEAGVVSSNDCFVLAINPRKLKVDFVDSNPPHILQAAYPIGPLQVILDKKTFDVIETKYAFRPVISKARGAEIETGLFLQTSYGVLSGLLCSRVDACNRPPVMGADYQFVPNPYASKPLPPALRLRGTYFKAVPISEGEDAEMHVIREDAD